MSDWWYLDTGWACGAVRVVSNVIVETAPIFWRFRGRDIAWLKRRYRVVRIGGR